MIKKGLYQFCQANFKSQQAGRLKIKPLITKLYDDYQFGQKIQGYIEFTEADIESLKRDLLIQDKLNFCIDPYPQKQSRNQRALSTRDEKHNTYPVSQDFVLLNSLKSFRLNQNSTALSELTSLGVYFQASQIISVEHQYIVLVENLAMMANLAMLNIPEALKNALWLYRGDLSAGKTTGQAYHFFDRFKESNTLICFSDLDPAGLQIAINSGASYWLTVQDKQSLTMELNGIEQDWFNQDESRRWLESKKPLNTQCQILFDSMNLHHKTLQQEQMLAHKVALALYPL